MNPNSPDDPLSVSKSSQSDMSKSAFISKRTNPYTTIMNNSATLASENANRSPSNETKPPVKPETPSTKPFAATSFSNPFQAKPNTNSNTNGENKNKAVNSASFVDTTTSSVVNQSSLFVNPHKVEFDNPNKSTIKRSQPILLSAGGVVQTPVPMPAKKEPLKGIYAFFGSEELPVNPKQVRNVDIPQSLEAISYIFENKCYGAGIDTIDSFMRTAPNADEKMYFRIIKVICLMRTQQWDKVNMEFGAVGNLDKIIFEPSKQSKIPYHLRLLYALAPHLSGLAQIQPKSSSAPKSYEEKTLERLFSLLAYCETFVKGGPYSQDELYENEQLDMQSICDTEITESRWVSRIFRTSLIIIELLLSKSLIKLAHEFLGVTFEKFPNNALLLTYQARLKMTQGDYSEAKNIFEIIGATLPQDQFLEFMMMNTFIHISQQLRYDEAEALIREIAEKYPEHATLAFNNLALIQFAQCKIREAIDTLEKIIKKEPWNINEVVAYNLFSAYDFYYTDTKERKKVINEIIDRYAFEFNKAAII